MKMNNNHIMENVAETEVMEVNTTEIAEVTPQSGFNMVTVAELANPVESAMYCSIKSDGSMKSKADIFNAVNSPDRKLSEFIGETINLKDIVAHPIQLIDENTGELLDALRVVLIAEDGTSYEAVSNGVANAVNRILQIFGQPDTWETPIKVKAVQKQTRNGNNKVTTLKIDM